MSEPITKKDLDEYQATILEAVNAGFEEARAERRTGFEEARKERTELKEAINQLTVTLDAFLKRLIDFEDEFTILKAEVAQMKSALKEKFGINISIQ